MPADPIIAASSGDLSPTAPGASEAAGSGDLAPTAPGQFVATGGAGAAAPMVISGGAETSGGTYDGTSINGVYPPTGVLVDGKPTYTATGRPIDGVGFEVEIVYQSGGAIPGWKIKNYDNGAFYSNWVDTTGANLATPDLVAAWTGASGTAGSAPAVDAAPIEPGVKTAASSGDLSPTAPGATTAAGGGDLSPTAPGATIS